MCEAEKALQTWILVMHGGGSIVPQGSPETAESDPKHTSKSTNNSKKSLGCSSQQNCP